MNYFLSVTFCLAIAFAFARAQDAGNLELAVHHDDDVAVIVSTEEPQEVQIVEGVTSCGCTKPSNAKAVFESILGSFSQNITTDVSSHFAPGAHTLCLAVTYLQNVSFEAPSYLIDLPNAVVGKVRWTYQFKESSEIFNDGELVFSVQTDAGQKITSFLVAHENDNFEQRVPKAKPTSVSALVSAFLGGLASFSPRESLAVTTEDFHLRILGDTSLFPPHLGSEVTRKNFVEFKEESSQVFDFTGKSVRCKLQSEDEDSSASHCQVVGKHSRVKFCLDALVLAEAKDGLLSSIDFYIAGACNPKTKFEDDSEKEEKRKEEERKAERKAQKSKI